MYIKKSWKETLLGIFVLLAFLLPHTSTMFMLANPLMCLVMFFFLGNRRVSTNSLIVIIPLILSLLMNITGLVSTKSILSIVSIMLFVLCFPYVREIKLDNKFIIICFAIILISQLAYLLKIQLFTNLLDTYYPLSWNDGNILAMKRNVTWGNMGEYRLGGLYRNPNQCARYLTFLLAYYLIINKRKSLKHLLYFTIPCLWAILITGSRTGLVISGLFVLSFLIIRNVKRNQKQFIILSVFFVFFVSGYYLWGENRSFDLSSGFQNSANLKLEETLNYMNNEKSIIKYMFGHFDYSKYNNPTASVWDMNFFDCDYGYIIYCYGFAGFLAFIFYYLVLFKGLYKIDKLFYVLFLWMITSTIILSYRALFVFMILLSLIYDDSRNEMALYKNIENKMLR